MKLKTLSACVAAVGLMMGCGSSAGSPLSASKNKGEAAVNEYISANSYFCNGDENVYNFYYGRPASDGFGNYLRHYQISNPKFRVVAEDISAADRQNGVTFSGWIMFDDQTTIRSRVAERHGWEKWSDWFSMQESFPEEQQGHYLIEKNGHWDYKKRGYQTFYGDALLNSLISRRGLQDPKKGMC